MFHSSSGLPHLLSPKAYCDDSWASKELTGPLAKSWHLVGIESELAKTGDFITTELLGIPLQIRRFDDGIAALSNVCAHRHCLISSEKSGRSDAMRCQYHGWEYGSDGLNRKIPCAKDFAPIDRDQIRLPRYQVDTCGQLVFVRLSPIGLGLQEFLGPVAAKMQAGFGPNTKSFFKWEVNYHANWKIAIENSLEAYHVQSVHPKTFRSDPGEKRSEHQLDPMHTAFGSDLPFAHSKLDLTFQQWEGWVVKMLGGTHTRRYWQHHVFPNLLCSYTDAISLVHCIIPTGTMSSRSIVYQFGICPDRPGIKRWLASLWGTLEAACTKRILKEDIEMYPRIQDGLKASQQVGRLARSEERIHRFQEYLMNQLNAGDRHD
jgi:phenylpropionate dioxygenase-like ring-hydroxylating dioxygenase large terminal subunit